MGQAVQDVVNLLLPRGSDADPADHHLAAFAADFDGVAQVRAHLVQRGDNLQFFIDGWAGRNIAADIAAIGSAG